MKKRLVLEKLFPFQCNTSGCKEYSSYRFFYAARNVGFIWLTNGKYSFVGLTCPQCLKTTINKYAFDIPDFDSAEFVNFDDFIPFPAAPFNNMNPKDAKSVSDLYHIPASILQSSREWHSQCYPEWFEALCAYHFDEKDIDRILKHENKEKVKVFPRITDGNTIYNQTDWFLRLLEKPDVVIDDSVAGTFVVLNQQLLAIANRNYLSGYAESSITEEKYRDLAVLYELACNYSFEFVEKAPDMLKEYVQVRNDLDFEKKCKTGFLDKYILEFYYSEGYSSSLQRINDKRNYEDFVGKKFLGGIKTIKFLPDDSGASEILTYTEILKRWDKDVAILKSFIVAGDLPAFHYAYGVWLDPEGNDFDLNNIHLEDFFFLKSDVEELEILKPWLNKNNADIENSESLTGKERRELGQLRTEKKKWNASITAAVQIGMWVLSQDGNLKRKDVEAKLHAIDPAIPNTTFEEIWKAIPPEYRHSGGRPKNKKKEKKDDDMK